MLERFLPLAWQKLLESPTDGVNEDLAQREDSLLSWISRVKRELENTTSPAAEDALTTELTNTQAQLDHLKNYARDYLINKWGFMPDFVTELSDGQARMLAFHLFGSEPDGQINYQRKLEQQIINELKSN